MTEHEMIEVWKVCYITHPHTPATELMVSYTADGKWQKKYMVGMWTKADAGTFLFCFESEEQARNWAKNESPMYVAVLRCLAEVVYDPGPYITSRPENWDAYWDGHHDPIREPGCFATPEGTVLCESILVRERVR